MNTGDIQIALPPSKSMSNRWQVVNHLMGGRFVLKNQSISDDSALLRRLLQQLKNGTGSVFYCENAGTVARFLLALLCTQQGDYVLTGDERLFLRPIDDLVQALRSMGFSITYMERDGRLPVRIIGGAASRKMVSVHAEKSSQFASALMLMGLALPMGVSVSLVGRIASRPYIEMTVQVLRQAGVEVSTSTNGHSFIVAPCPPPTVQKRTITIENDWSAAAAFYAAAALLPGCRIRLRNLSLDSCQGDRVVADIFGHLGVTTQQVHSPYRRGVSSLRITSNGECERVVKHNFVDCPDLFPSVAVACAALGVEARLRGIRNLRLKESDRIEAVENELRRMGCNTEQTDDQFRIIPSTLQAVDTIHTYGDHRIAMAFAPLLLLFPDMIIEDPDVVSKSFPDFWQQFNPILKWRRTNGS
ncbi:MAG: 3-phosphoshikimate 1-carboxyvinyltransferase [Bacteroidales bacterium]|nr:3-phosphoshikimate 1-carboxyvinyltransferase [Bacteroidales bacterium]